MKKKVLAFILITGTTVSAQDKNTDTTRLKFGKAEFIFVNSDTSLVYDRLKLIDEGEINGDLTYWGGIEVGVNSMMNKSFERKFDSPHLNMDPAQSFSYNLNFAEQRIRIVKDYFGIVTGLGFSHSRYGFNDNTLRLAANADSTWGYRDTTLVNGFTKNQLRITYLNIPILFQMNTSTNQSRNVHVSFGAIGGVRLTSNVKYKYDVVSGSRRDKQRATYNLNPFRLVAAVKLGYKDFGLFANYNLIPLFESNKSEEGFPLSVGASFFF